MRAGPDGRSWRMLLLVAICGLVVVGLGWEHLPWPRSLETLLGGDHDVRVYSHNGRWVLKPLFVLPSAPGQPPDFESRGWSLIRIPARLAAEGREMLVSGPGCGLLRGKFEGQDRITLPPPIRATIRVPGEFKLPSGDHGIELKFHASGVRPEIASVVAGAAVASNHWDKPESPVWDAQIWLDPVTRSVSVLLPCTGTWRVVWRHVERPPEGESHSLSILFGKGDWLLTVASDGEEPTLEIDPEELDPQGFGLSDD